MKKNIYSEDIFFLAMDPNKAHYVVVTGIIVKDDKFLIAKRSPNEHAFPNLWTVPGGKLESKDYEHRDADTTAGQWYNVCETLLRREVMEEVGLEIKKINYLASLVFKRPDGIPTVVISLYADHHSGDVKLCDDLTDHAWVTLEEAKNYELIDGIYEELEMLDQVMKGQKIGEWSKNSE
ncbi:MAG: NUDIX domain-containing protein [Candidatus Woesearchaeota archaeon]